MRRALQDGELRNVRRDRGANLLARCARADHHHLLAGEIKAFVPLCRMERNPCKILSPGNVGQFGSVEHPDCRDNSFGRHLACLAQGVAGCDSPKAGCIVIFCRDHFGLKLDMVTNAITVGGVFKIAPQLIALCEEMRPVMIEVEGIGIKMVGCVDAATGIEILVPAAADRRVFLDNCKGNAGFFKPNARAHARHSRADNDNRKRLKLFAHWAAAPVQAARVRLGCFQIFAHHRDIISADIFADGGTQHLPQRFSIGQRWQSLAGLGIVEQRIGEPGADFGSQGIRHRFMIVHRATDMRLCPCQKVSIPCQLDQHQHQRGSICLFQRGAQSRRVSCQYAQLIAP